MGESLYVIDGHAQIYRAYYAPFRDLTSPSGEPTRATYVFFSMLFNLLQQHQPTYVAMALDSPDSAASRRKIFADYKATREPPPEDLLPQMERIISLVKTMDIPVLSVPGYEADDIMATLSARLAGENLEVILVSKDKDLEQLITDRVRLYDPGKDEFINAEALQASKGYLPAQAIEIQTLTGDGVDDIPGIDGVGLKTAAKLIQQYGSAAAVMEHAGELTPRLGERVSAFAGQMAVTRELVTLQRGLAVEFDLESARFRGVPVERLKPVFQALGFTRLIAQLEGMAPATQRTESLPAPLQAAAPTRVPGVRYQLVNTPEKLSQMVQELARQQVFAIDTETTGLNPIDAALVGISLSWRAGEGYYIAVRGLGGPTLPQDVVIRALQPVLENPAIAKCGHNIKFDLEVLTVAGARLAGRLFDSMVASFLLNPLRRSHSMDWLARELYGHTMIPITDLIGRGRSEITMDQVDIQQSCEYAAEDADFTWRFYETLGPEIEASPLARLFHETEMPLVEVLARMELNGVALDSEFLRKMGEELESKRDALAEQIYTAAGRRFNIDSTRQLSQILYDEQDLRVVRKTKTGRSTDAETLATLARETSNPLPGKILEYRELSKLKSTYADSLPKMVSRRTGRVHGSYNMIGAVTGRLSSNDPNLQNIPVRTELGREIRRAFVAGSPRHVLLSADYSQIELRLLAHYCQDRALISAFEQNQDIHRFVAAQVFGVDLAEVTSEQRNRAKAVNFGIIYGQTAYGLSRTTGMSVGDAQRFIDLYFLRYPGIRLFIDSCIEQARRDGVAKTILGRRRPLPELHSRNTQQRSQGERLAVNTVLQGSAADLIKTAMVHIHRRIAQNPEGPRMLIQVHDELVFEVRSDNVETEAETIRQEMTTALPLKVPLAVDTAWGPNWLECKPGQGQR